MNKFHLAPLAGNGLTDNWIATETELVGCSVDVACWEVSSEAHADSTALAKSKKTQATLWCFSRERCHWCVAMSRGMIVSFKPKLHVWEHFPISPSLAFLYNLSIYTGQILADWNLSNMVPIPKEPTMLDSLEQYPSSQLSVHICKGRQHPGIIPSGPAAEWNLIILRRV